MKKWVFFLLAPLWLFAKIGLPEEEKGAEAPWLTGPLLATSATTVPVGHWAFEQYVYATDNVAKYQDNWSTRSQKDRWDLVFQYYLWVGLTNWCDIQLLPTWKWSHCKGPSKWTFDDFAVKLEFQLYRDYIPHRSWLPSIKFSVLEQIPNGKYKNLDPKKRLTDFGGFGSWLTTLQLALGRQFHLSGVHWLSARLVLDYIIPTPVHVTGYNIYGGGTGTHGTIYPGKQASFDISLEYTLTRHWALACDFTGNYQGTNKFSGTSDLPNQNPPFIQYAIAPAIEYNWSKNIGIIAGTWFTVAGKNALQFYSGVFALNYYH